MTNIERVRKVRNDMDNLLKISPDDSFNSYVNIPELDKAMTWLIERADKADILEAENKELKINQQYAELTINDMKELVAKLEPYVTAIEQLQNLDKKD